ncbi:MAG TPA: dihydrolipoamide acetyltransferase family protein [Streptosporangiaceae bacterium]|nr:dihydrolipoamide acetyltransferase family protein [Streptosporangiaceae bacterium]
MSELKQFRLPDVGEGLTEADIVKWHVQPGDKVTVNQIIVEIETAKAVVELPSPYEGVVADLLVPEGTTADVGTPIISVDVGPDAGRSPHPPAPRGSTSADLVPPTAAAEGGLGGAKGGAEPGIEGTLAPKEERPAVLVGYGVKLGSTTRRPRKAPAAAQAPDSAPASSAPPAASALSASSAPSAASARSATLAPVAPSSAGAEAAGGFGSGPATPGADQGTAVLAKPPVRKLAKDLGVDLARLSGTGPGGSITRDDVQAASSGPVTAVPAETRPAETGPAETGPAETGTVPAGFAPVTAVAREERIPIRGVRKHTAAAVAGSAFTAPHVTEFLQIDITETMAATARLRAMPEFAGIRVSPLLLVARALMVAVARHPMINSSWDEDAQEIVVRHYVNLGIAAATERGLIVPNIRDAHALSLPGLARALAELAETARAGRATPADLRGGTITITNVGVFGVDTGTPILTPGEAAILAFGQVKDAPWVHEGQLAVRKVTTLALSFDHRIVDGDLGSAVLRDIGEMLEDPLRILAWS